MTSSNSNTHSVASIFQSVSSLIQAYLIERISGIDSIFYLELLDRFNDGIIEPGELDGELSDFTGVDNKGFQIIVDFDIPIGLTVNLNRFVLEYIYSIVNLDNGTNIPVGSVDITTILKRFARTVLSKALFVNTLRDLFENDVGLVETHQISSSRRHRNTSG